MTTSDKPTTEEKIDDAKYKLRDVVTSYIDIAFIEMNGELLDGAISALNKAKASLKTGGKSKLEKIFGGKGVTFS